MDVPAAPIASDSDAAAYMAATKRDPVGWSRRVLGISPWTRQSEVMQLLRDNDRVAVKSGHAVGKSFVSAAVALWYSECHVPSYVITTSSAWTNVEKTTWPEIRKMKRYAPYDLGGRMLDTEWKRGIQWGIFSVSPDRPENFSGFRTPHGVLVIIDEASAIEPDIMEAILGLTMSGESKILMIGNPLRPQGPFYDAFNSKSWAAMTISSYDVPNVIQGRPIIPGLCTRERIEERAGEWGRDSAAFKSRVLGEFPDSAEDMLVPLSWIEAAFAREYPAAIDGPSLCMGADIAREGGDRIVFLVRDAYAVRHMEIHQHKSLMDTAGRIIAVAKEHGVSAERVLIDDVGMGGGVTDRLRELDVAVTPVNFGHAAKDKIRFANTRAEAYWRVREWLDPTQSGTPGAIPSEHKALGYEVTIPQTGYTSAGQIKIEPKDAIKKRLGRSPDLADALALTFAVRPGVSMWMPGDNRVAKAATVSGLEEVDRGAMIDKDEAWN